MNFLVDAQLPTKLCEILSAKGFHAEHVISLPDSDESSDNDISIYADNNGFIIITKDSDFYHSHMIFEKPKQLLLITIGNIKNRQLFDIFRSNIVEIERLFETCDFVELSNDNLIGH